MNHPDVSTLARSRLVIGSRQVDIGLMRVVGRGEAGRLTPKSLAILLELARCPQQTISRAELLDRVWADSDPTPDVLNYAIKELRKALGDDARAPTLIQTVHGLGYRLVQPVRWEEQGPQGVPAGNEDCAPPDEAAPTASDAGAAHRPVRARAWYVLAAAFAGAVALTVLAVGRPPAAIEPAAPREWRTLLVTSEPVAEEYPALSPDGAMVAYAQRPSASSRYDLRLKSLHGTVPVALTATEDVDEIWPVWSPDGMWIAYLAVSDSGCHFEVMAATGGAARRIAPCDRHHHGRFDWAPDGTHLLAGLPADSATGGLRLHRIWLATGRIEPLAYEIDDGGWDRDPAYSADGSMIAFRRGIAPSFDLHVMPAQGGRVRRLTRLGSVGDGLAWTADGNDVVFWSDLGGSAALYFADPRRGNVREAGIAEASRPHVARRTARLAFQRPLQHVALHAFERDGPGEPVQVSPSTGSVRHLVGAPDRSRFAYVSNRRGFEQIWVHDAQVATDRAYGDESADRITSIDWSDDGGTLLLIARQNAKDRVLTLDLASGRISETGLEADLLRNAVFGADADSIYAIVQHRDRSLLARFHRNDGRWTRHVTDIPAVELVRASGLPGVLVRDPHRPERIVHVHPELGLRAIELHSRVYGWTAEAGAIWYVSASTPDDARLRRYRFDGDEDVDVGPVPSRFPRRRACIALLGEQVVISLLDRDAADVGVVLDFR